MQADPARGKTGIKGDSELSLGGAQVEMPWDSRVGVVGVQKEAGQGRLALRRELCMGDTNSRGINI